MPATELYLEGRAEDALNMIFRLPRDEVRDGAQRLYQGSEIRDRYHAQALVALWTEVQVEAFQGVFDDPLATPDPSWPRLACRYQGRWVAGPLGKVAVRSGPTLIERLQEQWRPTLPFLQAWYVLVLAHYEGWDGFNREDCLVLAPPALKNQPTFLLSEARHHEGVWFFRKEANFVFGTDVVADLKKAQMALETALALQPDLEEARLRLGRVLALRGQPDEALKALARVAAPMNPRFVYLARLFEADIFETRGDVGRALDAYASALSAYPGGHAAEIGWARLTFAAGRRNDAQASLARWAKELGTASLADPWAEYFYGFEGQIQRCREALRAAVRER